jgi:hypothetical protein
VRANANGMMGHFNYLHVVLCGTSVQLHLVTGSSLGTDALLLA